MHITDYTVGIVSVESYLGPYHNSTPMLYA